MARNLFGGSSDDYAVDSTGRPIAVRRVRFYTSAAMTTEVTDLASDAAGTGAPLTVNTDAHGFWGPVYGPDGVTTMYAGTVDSGGNPPAYVVAIYTHTSGGVASFNTRAGAVSLTKADVTATALAAADVGAPNVVVHGSTAGTARPSGATVVHWIGSVAPTNVTGNDEWTDTTSKLLKRWNGTSFDALGSAAYVGLSSFRKQQVRTADVPVPVMTTPPTVTKGVAGAGSTIASSVLVQAVADAAWTIRGGSSATAAVRFGGTPTYYDNHTVTSTLDQNLPWFHDIAHYGSKFEVQIAATSAAGWLQVYVNDQPVAASVIAQTDNNASGYKYLIDFGGVSDVRRITIACGGIAFGGIYVGPNDSVWKIARPRLTRALFLGDSFTVTSNATRSADGYPLMVGQTLGWDDIWHSGEAGTGYLAAGSGGGRTTFRGRVAADVTPYAPDVVVVYGGTNDIGQTPSAIQTEAQALYAAILAALPNVALYVVGIQYPSGAADATRDAIDTALAAAVAATPGAKGYISAKTWITGTGHVGATTGSGNGDLFVSSDGLHPTSAGHAYIGKRIAQGIAALL